ncbi:MAG: endoribonuclease MazF [bacterium]|nr:endoribonuclease MazF [bacterium]
MVAPEGRDGYVPERGDIVWLPFDPQAGHEQAGRRPALVISPRAYNGRVGLALFCPLTTQVKGYPFEVVLPAGGPAVGAVLADQVKSLDWGARGARKFGQVNEMTMAEVLGKIGVLVG